MLGELALSERALADHSILLLGSQTVSAEFIDTSAANLTASGEAEMSAIAIKVSIGSGVLLGLMQATAEFTQSSNATRFATGISAQVFSTIQGTDAIYIASGISDQDAAFIVESSAQAILDLSSDMSAEFTQTSSPNMLYSGISNQSAEFTQTTTPNAIYSGLSEIEAVFINTGTGSIIKDPGPVDISAAFIQTTDGRLFWERIDADVPSENWVQIVPTGGIWTPVNASGTINIWTNKVV